MLELELIRIEIESQEPGMLGGIWWKFESGMLSIF